MEDELSALVGVIRKTRADLFKVPIAIGRVEEHALYQSSSEKNFGVGAIRFSSRMLRIGKNVEAWARPHRLQQGRFDVPPIGSFVILCKPYLTEHIEYYGGFFWDDNTNQPFATDEPNKEELGFFNATPNDFFGAERFREARMAPDKVRILESSSSYIIGVNDTDKILDVRVKEGYEIHLSTGANGKIEIGNYDTGSKNDSGPTEVNVRPGPTGKFSVKFRGGHETLAEAGKITHSYNSQDKAVFDFQKDEATFSFRKVTFETPAGDIVIENGDVVAGPTKISLTKHTHPTTVPGPPSPPSPGA